jgi:tetratricopeptide (TPR) repeat protein
MKPQPHYQPGDKIGGRYQVHQALMGGMGEVYLCLDLETIQPYALKTFQQRFLTNLKLRHAFENEVATWVALEKHSNIVRCFYMDILDHQPFVLLEWIAGEEGRGADLRGWLRHGPLDLRLALDFTIDICRGLIHAGKKQLGLVHRDLKPENILVAQGRLAKITDWGLAQIAHKAELDIIIDAEGETDGRQSLLVHNGIVGTPPYMAPEQWRGEALDVRTDIYAVGCILYEMLGGGWPFQASTLDDLRRQHLEADIPKLTNGQPLPDSLDTLLAGCLAKRRENRFATVEDLLQQLDSIYQQQFAELPKSTPITAEFTVADYGNRGFTYHNLKQYDAALADYNRAIQLDPNEALAFNNRGMTYAALQRHEEALADYSRAIKLEPTEARFYSNRGNTYVALQWFEKALDDQSKAIQLDPTDAIAYSNRGGAYHSLRRYDEALADYDRALELDPTQARVHYNRARIYTDLERYDEALADYSQAILLSPGYAAAYLNRGKMYANLQRYDEALADYDQSIQLDPTLVQAYSNRGAVYADLQRHGEALANYGQAIQVDPDYAPAYYNRGNTYASLKRHEGALADYSRAIQLDPTYAQAYGNRGSIYHTLQQYDEALADFDQAIQLDPTYAQAYGNRGSIYHTLQQYDEALANYSQAIQLDPNLAQAYLNIGFLFIGLGQLRTALPYFEEAAQRGLRQGAQYAAQIRRMLGTESTSQVNPVQLAIVAFFEAGSLEEMQRVVAQFPFMLDTDSITGIEQILLQQSPSDLKSNIKQHLAWLRQIAYEQKQDDESQ